MRSIVIALPLVVGLLPVACGDDSSGPGGNAGDGASGDAGETSSGGTSGDGGTSANAGRGGTAGSSSAGEGGSSAGGVSGAGGAGGDGEGGSGGAGECVLGTTWETLDDFQLAKGENSNPSAIATASDNRLFAVGLARMGTFQWYVRRSIDGGENWDNLDVASGGASDVAVDSMGVVFVAGTRANNRIVRRSTNGGDDWTTVDTVALSTTDPCSAGSLVITSDDTVYVGGGCDSTGVTVRRSTNGGESFNEVESFKYQMTTATRMGPLGVDANDQVYVGGHGIGTDASSHWLARRGTGMGTWIGADDYQRATGRDASLSGFGGRDAIYAVGSGADANGIRHWITRRAALDNPTNFTTVDDVAAAAMADSLDARALYQAPTGEVIAAGRSAIGTAPGRVVYRRSDDGVSFRAAGDFVYTPGADSEPAGRLVSDAAGNVYGMVRGVDADGFAHWIVRKLPCTSP